jgi:homoserine O-acetyltransferase/O-succinyltransferase
VTASNHTFEAGDVRLVLGGVLRRARIDYRVHGTLAGAGDNLVLFPHMYSGGIDSLDRYVGPGRALDPRRLCVVVPGQLGNGSATSPSNAPTGELPRLTVADDVELQRRLVDRVFGVRRLRLVVGYSMGAHQAYEWAVGHPDRVERLMVIAGASRTSPAARTLIDRLSRALRRDRPLERHAELWRGLAVPPRVYADELWRTAGYESAAHFTRVVFDEDLGGRDPRDLCCQLAKWRAVDVSRHAGGDLAAALGRIRAATSVMAFRGDVFAPPEQCAGEAALIRGADAPTLETSWGHYAFGGFEERDVEAIDAAIGDVLERAPCG